MKTRIPRIDTNGSKPNSGLMQFVIIRAISVFGCAALLISLLSPVAQMHAQTQAAMNAQARAEFEQADAELNKTYEALLRKLPDAESKEKLKQSHEHGSPFEMPRRLCERSGARRVNCSHHPLRNP